MLSETVGRPGRPRPRSCSIETGATNSPTTPCSSAGCLRCWCGRPVFSGGERPGRSRVHSNVFTETFSAGATGGARTRSDAARRGRTQSFYSAGRLAVRAPTWPEGRMNLPESTRVPGRCPTYRPFP
eukprot:1207552-Prymnesium_polylepis.1